MGERVIGRRGLNHPRQQRGLRHGEVLGVDVEIHLRRGLHAVRPVAELHEVQIPGQNLVLGEVFIQVRRQFHLAKLARDGVLVGGSSFVVGLGFDQHEVVLDVLLVQGGRALGDPAVCDVRDDRSGSSAQVNAVMVIEPSVFNGDDRFLHRFRDLIRRDFLSALCVEGGKGVPVPVGHGGDLRELGAGNVVVIGVHGVVATVDRGSGC